MTEAAKPFTLKNRHLSAVIRLLQGHLDPDDPEGDVNLEKAKDNFDLCNRVLSSGIDGKAVKDSDLGTKTTPTQGGEHGNKDRELQGTQETARDKRASDTALARARNSRMNGPTSPFFGLPDYKPGKPIPLAKDGRPFSIDSVFGQSAPNTGGDVTLDDIFARG